MDILAAFRNIPGVKVEAVEIDLEPATIAREVATAAALQIQENFRAGRAPDGGGMKPLKPSTLAQRQGGGPRGIDTGRLVASIKAEPGPDGSYTVSADERGPGHMRTVLAGRRWAVNPAQETLRNGLLRAAAGMVKKP